MTVQPLIEKREPLPEPSTPLQTPEKTRTMLTPDLLPTESRPDFSVDRVSPGVTQIILRPGARITDDDCVRTRAELLALTGGKPAAVLLQITGVHSVGRSAISLYSEAAAVMAFAILGGSPVDRVIAHALLRLAPPACPTKYFTNEDEAVIWLRTTGQALEKLRDLDRTSDPGTAGMEDTDPRRHDDPQPGPSQAHDRQRVVPLAAGDSAP